MAITGRVDRLTCCERRDRKYVRVNNQGNETERMRDREIERERERIKDRRITVIKLYMYNMKYR